MKTIVISRNPSILPHTVQPILQVDVYPDQKDWHIEINDGSTPRNTVHPNERNDHIDYEGPPEEEILDVHSPLL